jgi:hypothetical protein
MVYPSPLLRTQIAAEWSIPKNKWSSIVVSGRHTCVFYRSPKIQGGCWAKGIAWKVGTTIAEGIREGEVDANQDSLSLRQLYDVINQLSPIPPFRGWLEWDSASADQ